MLRRLPVAIAILGLVSTSVLSTTFAAKAQEMSTKAQNTASDESHGRHFKLSAEDRAAFLTARIAALHAGLELTPDQEKLWAPVETALRDFSKLIWTQRQKFREERHQHDPIEHLQRRSENLIARGQALKTLADAAAPLYAALSDAQKHRLPILARAIFHPFRHHHHFAGRGEWGHGEHGHHGWDRDRHEDGGNSEEMHDRD